MVSVQSICTECLLKSARAHIGTLDFLSFLVCTCSSSVVLSFVEVLTSALFTYHLLVASYEPGKESSVSVCHNSNFDLVNNRCRTQNVPRSFEYLSPHAILWGQQWIFPSINPWKQHPTHLSVTISHSRSIPCLSITFTVSIILKFWLIAGSTNYRTAQFWLEIVHRTFWSTQNRRTG